MKTISALSLPKSLGEMPKVRWKQKICSKDSVRREIQYECHCAWSLFKVTWTCPIWQPEKMVEKLNRLSCLERFCCFGITQAADLDCWSCCWFPQKTDRLVWLVDSEQMRESYCTPGAAATIVKRCSSWGSFHCCGLTASWYGDLANQHSTTVL